MRVLQKVREEKFGKVKCDFYQDRSSDEIYMTARQLGEALEYAHPVRSINKMISRKKYNYLKQLKYSTNVILTSVDDKRLQTRVFTEKGIYGVIIASGQPKIIFMNWLTDIL